jgi:hypothetical protein
MAVLLVGLGAMSASADNLYNSIPVGMYSDVQIGNSPNDFTYSMPFYADNVSAFGQLISNAYGITTGGQIAFSDWGTASQYAAYIAANPISCVGSSCTGANSTGFYTNVTVSLYNPGSSYSSGGDTLYTVGSQIASQTTNVFIDWRPAPDTSGAGFTCTDGIGSYANPTTGNEQCGAVNLVDFNLNAIMPGTEIYTVSIPTGTGANNPDDSLNFGINPFAPSAGSDPTPDTAYYACSGSSVLNPVNGCNGTVQGDTGWASTGEGAISFSPEPATFGLIGFGLVGLGFVARRKKKTTV